MSEELVIRQAAPTLAGIKTGSLFPCPCEDKAALLAEIRAFNRRYQARGLCLLPLRFTKGKALLYLYRPAALQRDLDSDAAAKLLAGAGYPCGSCGGCVAALVRRMRSSAEFPHEVGLFLSYPPETARRTPNAPASGRCTATSGRRGRRLQNIKNVRRFTASAGSPAPGWTSWPSQTDKADPAGRRPAVRDQKG